MFSRWMNGLLGFALALCLVSFAPTPSFAACKASAEGSFSSGFEITGNVVTLCGTAVEVQPARSAVVVTTIIKTVVAPTPKPTLKSVLPKPIVAPKPVIPTKPVVSPKPPIVLKIIMVDRYVPPPPKVVVPPPPKPTPTPTPTKKPTPAPTPSANTSLVKVVTVVSTPESSTTDSGSISFTPTAMLASVSDSSLKVGQAAIFSADPFTHYRTGAILGRAAEVSFTPGAVTWSFSGGGSSVGATTSRSFPTQGVFSATASVVYSVAYRFVASGGWINQGSISMQSTVSVQVSSAGTVSPTLPPTTSVVPSVGKKRVVLVARNCLVNSAAIGCLSG